MKLKMAEKSLFAILLRSPWWLSFCLAGLIALASKALLPDQLVPYGVLGGFPFVVIGCIAAWRQLQAPSPARINESLVRLSSQSWRDFSNDVERAFQGSGQAVTRVNVGGADFKLEKGGHTTLVSCKRWKAVNQGVEALRELTAAKTAQGADFCTFISLVQPTDSALRFARDNQVQLVFGNALAQLISNKKGL
jgi:restriction system protein